MRKLSLTLATTALMVVGLAAPASAHIAGPCDAGGGVGYAQHHIRPMAQAGMLGNGGHKPGSHRGFSICH